MKTIKRNEYGEVIEERYYETNDKLHREDGHAVIILYDDLSFHTQEYWIHGRQLSEAEFKFYMAKKKKGIELIKD